MCVHEKTQNKKKDREKRRTGHKWSQCVYFLVSRNRPRKAQVRVRVRVRVRVWVGGWVGVCVGVCVCVSVSKQASKQASSWGEPAPNTTAEQLSMAPRGTSSLIIVLFRSWHGKTSGL